MLEGIFSYLLEEYTTDKKLMQKLWVEIDTAYAEKHRKYHNLNHLKNVYLELSAVKEEITEWNSILFALFYHDIIYNAKSNKNEENSADLAKLRITDLGMPSKMKKLVTELIHATKSHTTNQFKDINLFNDADLSILGKDWPTYKKYLEDVRQEYKIYPDLIYKPGRKKVLIHFLKMETIFKTTYFKNKYEKQARVNLEKELKLLTNPILCIKKGR